MSCASTTPITTLRAIDRLQRLDDAELLDRLADAGLAPHAGGVDQHVVLTVALERHLDRVARRAGLVERDQPLFAEQPVDQRRLADVRAGRRPRRGSPRAPLCCGESGCVGRPSRARRARAPSARRVPIRCADEIAIGSPKPKRWNSALRHLVLEALGLVGDDEHRLAAAAQDARRRAGPAACSPARASTTNSTRSASSTAFSVCSAISRSTPGTVSTRPPVSITTQERPPRRA